MQWVKGYNRIQSNKGSNVLVKQGANKRTPDLLNLEIPKEIDSFGAKWLTLTQVTTHRGILERK